MDPAPRRTVPRTLLWFCAFSALPLALRARDRAALRALFAAPRADDPRAASTAGPGPSFTRTGAAASSPEVPAAPLPAPWRTRRLAARRVHAIDDPCVRPAPSPQAPAAHCEAHALDAFYRALDGVERTHATARVAHLGDSVVADDKITGRIRARLQQEFGDAGPGFAFLRPPARWYHPAGLRWDSRGFGLVSVVGPRVDDGLYGLSGVGFTATDTLAFSSIRADRAQRIELYYLPQEGGGALSVTIDDAPPQPVATGRDATGFHSTRVPDGAHTLTVRVATAPVRAFGAVFEREGGGVVVDNLGVIGNSARALLHTDAAHLRAQFEHRTVDLYLVLLGTNDASHGVMAGAQLAQLERDSRALYQRLRAVRGEAACLVMAPPDAMVTMQGELVQRPAIPGIVEAERRAALAEGCAFWNTYTWMGGPGAIERWRLRGWAEADFTHVSDAGGAQIGDALTDALLSGRDAFHARTSPTGVP